MKPILKLFANFNKENASEQPPGAYQQQVHYCKQVWQGQTYGLERLVRLFLCAVQFAFPLLLVRDIFGRAGLIPRRLAVEAYTTFKFILPLCILSFGFYRYPALVILTIYLLSETILHILSLIFLADVYPAAPSYRRSILLLFLHYLEVVFDFAVIYIAFGLLSEPLTPLSAVYFSLVANTTVGFGDIHAHGPIGQAVVISQLIICVLFVILFINYFSQREK